MDDVIERLFAEVGEGRWSGRNKNLGIRWSFSSKKRMLLCSGWSYYISWAILPVLKVIYQVREFKNPYPEVGTWAYNFWCL